MGRQTVFEGHSIIHNSGLITLTLASTTKTLYTPSPNTSTGIIRPAKIVKIMTFTTGGMGFLTIGYGNFTQSFPSLLVLNNVDCEWLEDEIPAISFIVPITVQCSAAGCTVMVDVEETGE